MNKHNKLFYFFHPVTGKSLPIYNGRSMWEDQMNKDEYVVVKVQGPAMDHWEEAMNYGIGTSQPEEIDWSGCSDINIFKRNALSACGISNHPKAETAWQLALEYGHGKGVREVFNHLQDLTTLIKE